MIKEVIEYIDTRLALTGYFQKQWGLVEIVGIQGEQNPMKYCGNAEWKKVLDIDSKQGHCYIRRNGNTTISENSGQNQISCEKLFDISIPLKVVCFIKRSFLSVDDEFAIDRASDTIMKSISEQSFTLASTIKAKRVNIVLSSKQMIPHEVLRAEKQRIDRELPYEYMLFSIDLNVIVTSRRECIIDECAPSDECANLRAYLNREQKICILQSFDFSDQVNVDELTEQQINDLIVKICTGTGGDVTIYESDGVTVVQIVAAPGSFSIPTHEVRKSDNSVIATAEFNVNTVVADSVVSNSDNSYTQNVLATDVLVLPDTTYDVYVNGVLQASTTVPTLKNETINIVWQ